MGGRLLALLLVCTLACTTVTPRDPGPALVKDPNPLTVWIGPVQTLHPHRAHPHLTAALFSPLVVSSPSDHLPAWGPDVPHALLERLASEDLRRWDLTIKSGWTWHDGSPVTAEDVGRGWQAAVDARLPATSTISDIRVRDKSTMSFALSAPFGQLPALLADPAFLPLPELAVTDPGRFADAPIGTGPFRLAGRDGQTLLLQAVDAHPGGTPRSSDLGISLAPEPDIADEVVVLADGSGAADQDREQVVRANGRQLAYLGVPLVDARYRDPSIRRALSLAIDRASLVDEVLGGAGVPADRLVGPGVARSPDVSCPDCRFDPNLAAELWPDDFDGPLTIWFAADAGHEVTINAIAGAWRTTLGVQNIQLASLPAEDLLDRLQASEVSGPFRLSWAADVPSATRVLQPLLGPRGAANDVRYRNPEFGDALNAADLTRDLTQARQGYGRAEQIAIDDLPVIPLWFSTVTVLADGDVSVQINGAGLLDWVTLAAR